MVVGQLPCVRELTQPKGTANYKYFLLDLGAAARESLGPDVCNLISVSGAAGELYLQFLREKEAPPGTVNQGLKSLNWAGLVRQLDAFVRPASRLTPASDFAQRVPERGPVQQPAPVEHDPGGAQDRQAAQARGRPV